MAIQIKALGEFPSPSVVDYHSRPELRCLNDGFGFTAILSSLPTLFQQQKINGSLVVSVAPLEKRVVGEDRMQTIFLLLGA